MSVASDNPHHAVYSALPLGTMKKYDRASQKYIRGPKTSSVSSWTSRRVLEVTVKNCINLPKTDMIGKTDPYVRVMYAGHERTTKTIEKDYNPSFEETFSFDIASDEAVRDLTFIVMDNDKLKADEETGRVNIGREQIAQILLDSPQYQTETYQLKDHNKDKLIYGQEKSTDPAIINIAFKVIKGGIEQLLEPLSGLGEGASNTFGRTSSAASVDTSGSALAGTMEGIEEKEELTEDWEKALVVEIISAKNLPKTDTFFGKTDPYVNVYFGNQKEKTAYVEKNYDPVWNESFTFVIPEEGKPIEQEELLLEIKDQDTARSNDNIGFVTVSKLSMQDFCKSEIGQTRTFTDEKILSGKTPDSKGVLGHNKKQAIITFKTTIVKVAREDIDSIRTKWMGAGPQKEKSFSMRGLFRSSSKKAAGSETRKQDNLGQDKDKIKVTEEVISKFLALQEVTKSFYNLHQSHVEGQAQQHQIHIESFVAHALGTLMPYLQLSVPQPDIASVPFSDLIIEVLDGPTGNQKVVELPAHCNVMWARCPGIKDAIQEAYNGNVTPGFQCLVLNMNEVDKKKKKGGQDDKAKEGQNPQEHDWNPRTCISVPGSVIGNPMRCSCAHGNMASGGEGGPSDLKSVLKKGANKAAGRVDERKLARLRILGVRKSVIEKVLDYIYKAKLDFWEEEEVPEAIMVSRVFQFRHILESLFIQGKFPRWGCAMWEAAIHIDVELGEDFEFELYITAERVLSEKVFEHDGMKHLSEPNFEKLLKSEYLQCDELKIFHAVVRWCKNKFEKETEKYQKTEAAKSDEQKEKEKKEGTAPKPPKYDVIAKKQLRHIRYPFISPEDLEKEVSFNKDYHEVNLKVSDHEKGQGQPLPMALAAVFLQSGQRWDLGKELDWIPRYQSLQYHGDWEWMFGPAAYDDGTWDLMSKLKHYNGEDQIEFAEVTAEELKTLGYTKMIIQFCLAQSAEKDGKQVTNFVPAPTAYIPELRDIERMFQDFLPNEEYFVYFDRGGVRKPRRSVVAAGRVRPSILDNPHKKQNYVNSQAFIIYSRYSEVEDVMKHMKSGTGYSPFYSRQEIPKEKDDNVMVKWIPRMVGEEKEKPLYINFQPIGTFAKK